MKNINVFQRVCVLLTLYCMPSPLNQCSSKSAVTDLLSRSNQIYWGDGMWDLSSHLFHVIFIFGSRKHLCRCRDQSQRLLAALTCVKRTYNLTAQTTG